MRTTSLIVLTVLISMVCPEGTSAQLTSNRAGKFDRGFGTNGFSTIMPGRRGAVLVLDNGTAFATGSVTSYPSTGISLSKQLYDGAPDTSFGQGGVQTVWFQHGVEPGAIAVQSDGKILVGGLSSPAAPTDGADLFLIRFSASGQLDTTFGNSGSVILDIVPDTHDIADSSFDVLSSIVALPDGGIVVGGSSLQKLVSSTKTVIKAIVVKFTPVGTLDPSFGASGISSAILTVNDGWDGTTYSSKLIPLLNGNFVIGMTVDRGRDNAKPAMLVRFLNDGSPDKVFGIGGTVDLTQAPAPGYNWFFQDIAELANKKLIVLTGAAITRLNEDGAIDKSFGDRGQQVVGSSSMSHFTVLRDGSLITTASYSRNTVYGYRVAGELRRYFADGGSDIRFGTSGRAYIDIPGYDTYLGSIFQVTDSTITVIGNSDPNSIWQIYRAKVYLKRKL